MIRTNVVFCPLLLRREEVTLDFNKTDKHVQALRVTTKKNIQNVGRKEERMIVKARANRMTWSK